MGLAPEPGIGERIAAERAAERAEPSQVVAVRYDDIDVEVRDLSLDVLNRIARRNGTEWFMVVDAPTSDLGVARDVLTETAALAGATPPPFDSGRQAIEVIRKYFVLVDDDVPALPNVGGGEENPTDAG